MDLTLETGALTEEVTVTADAALLQTDVALRKTVEAKDIEQLSFNGRNPIGVAGLKAGVSGGSFNNYGAFSLSNGGWNINGSRGDENNITVDGATAMRTRSNGAIVGVQNVDTIQEVQVLTGSYMPEYGRASGGQVRLVTKSGSNRFSGSAGYYYRDDKLQANTWARNRSTNAIENSGPAPFDFKQYGYSFGGPILKNRLFFFGAQEWANQDATATSVDHGADDGDAARRLQRAARTRTTASSPARAIINDPLTGQPFPGNIIPASRLSPNGLALMDAVPGADPRLPPGHQQRDHQQREPPGAAQGQHPLRLASERERTSSRTASRKSNYKAIDAFRGDLPFARTDWDRPELHARRRAGRAR